MKCIITFLFCVIFISPSLAQITFDRTYSPDASQVGKEVFQTSDGGYLLQTTIIGNWNNCYIIKTDSIGDTLWTKTYGTDSIQFLAYDAIQTDDGGYIICGDYQRVDDQPNMDSYVQKIDSLGNEVWFNKYGLSTQQNGGKDHAELIKILNDGTIVIEGWAKHVYYSPTNIYNPLSFNGYVSTFDPQNGNLLDIISVGVLVDSLNWVKWYSSDIETINNTIFILGLDVPGSSIDNVLLAIDRNLDTLFTIKNNLGNYYGLSATQDKHLLLFGKSIISKMDTLGNIIWTTNNLSNSYPYEIIETTNGELISIGNDFQPLIYEPYGAGSWDVYLNKHDATGSLIWNHTFSSHSANDIIESDDGGYAFTGSSYNDIWFAKTDSIGNVITSITYPVTKYSQVNLYPNPNNGIFTIESELKLNEIFVYDVEGKLVHNAKVQNDIMFFDIRHLKKGAFFYKILSSGSEINGKFLIE